MSNTARAKYQVTAPSNAGEDVVAAEDKMEGNRRKRFHGRGAKGHSGKGHVKTPHRRGGRS